MPIPRFVRPFTKRFINPVTRLFAARLPGFAMVSYVGRRSGRVYHLPLNVFHRRDEYTFALTYGPDVQWVRNVLAAGNCEVESGGRVTRLVEPRLVHDPTRSRMPQPVRSFLGLMGVHEFLVMRADRSGASPAGRAV